MHLTEGRNTGFRKILKALERNGSPLPEFITDDEHSFFITRLFIREDFYDENGIENSESGVENVTDSVTDEIGDTKYSDDVPMGLTEIDVTDIAPENVTDNVTNLVSYGEKNSEGREAIILSDSYSEGRKELARMIIFEILKDSEQSANQISDKIGVSKRTVLRYIKEFQEAGVLFRVGNNKSGKWVLK